MNITYRVHRASVHPVAALVHYNGKPMHATVPEYEVELVDHETGHGTLTLRFRMQEEVDEAKEMFAQGDTVTLSFEKVNVEHISTEAEEPAPAA